MSEQAAVGRASANAQASGGLLIKLVIFSLSLGLVPITSYFASLRYLWNGNATYAAITAVVSANIVLVAYIITSLLEDQQTAPSVSQKVSTETRKQR